MLPPATEKVWNFLQEQPALAGFVLVGGSALSLTINHRISEDLDLIFPEVRLPRQRLHAFLHKAGESGFEFQPDDDDVAVQEFADSALELHDFQQDFLVNGNVKVSFFTPDDGLRKVLQAGVPAKVRIASIGELFKAKCLISAKRSKTRDWLDLYLLMRNHGFSIQDYRAAFKEAGYPGQCDTGIARLCSGVPQKDDEGYAHLLTKPPSLEEMKAFFISQREKLEIETAAEAKRGKTGRSARVPSKQSRK